MNLQEEIIKSMDLSAPLSDEEVRTLIDEALERVSKKMLIGLKERERLRTDIFHSIRQLGILQDLIEDPEITEIMVNGTDGIFIEKHGKLTQLPERFLSKDKLRQVIWQITADCNRAVNDAKPIVDARLPDGARVNVVLDPVALNGPILTIRRFPPKPIMMEDLIRMGSITEECSDFLIKAVREGQNLLVSGGTGTGKTTLLNVLSGYIPPAERVITIEDSAELQLQGLPNLVRLETRNGTEGGGEGITIRDLLKTSLRMRPDRIIVGETRSKEAIDMLQSINVGHSAMTTVHANSVRDVVSRLETMVLTGMEIPVFAIRRQIASGFGLIIQLTRCPDGSRKVFEVARPLGIRDGEVEMESLFFYGKEREKDRKEEKEERRISPDKSEGKAVFGNQGGACGSCS
ncbi:MAG: Flp pilus assembly complex ATPase component TadA [Lachnospiraceae bacterium]|nr:Flp pilus assembly complex ATPase component TadA [Lachnospiraceae bacterium]